MLRSKSAGRRVTVAIAVCLWTGCAGRRERIADLSLSFMAKDGEECFAAKCGRKGVRRYREVAKLARLGAFRTGMSPAELRRLLGEATFVWDDVPEAVRRSDGFDRRHVYQLGIGLSLRAEFDEGALKRLYWYDEMTGKAEGRRRPVRLARARR